jgi:soluble lytic murein transglycosylase
VRQWLPEEGTLDADLWAETVPFFETRKYIKKVMEYTTVYEQRLGQSNGTMLARMGRIQAGAGK